MTQSDFSYFLADPNDLGRLLDYATPAELDNLVDILTDNGDGRISLDAGVRMLLLDNKSAGTYGPSALAAIEQEICLFGGNSLANTYRSARKAIGFGEYRGSKGNGVEFQEIVEDIGKHVKANFPGGASVIQMERAILEKLGADAYNAMSPEEQQQLLKDTGLAGTYMSGEMVMSAAIAGGRMGGFATYQYVQKVVQMIWKFIFGKGLPVTVVSRWLSVALGPVGMAVTGIWSAYDFTTPAYRVTVPCVVQIAVIRLRVLQEANSAKCRKCEATNSLTANFCVECGESLARDDSGSEQSALPS